MRILAVHSRGEVAGGSDGVYVHGTRLLAERGHEVAWLTAGSCDTAVELGHLLFSFPGFWSSSGLRRQVELAEGIVYSHRARKLTERAVEVFRPDVAHIHILRHTLSPSVLLALREYGVPVVQTLHDYRLICPVNSFLSDGRVCEACRGGRYCNCIRQRCARGRSLVKSVFFSLSAYVADHCYHHDDLVTAYIAPSEFLRQKMIAFGYEPGKIVTLHNAYFGQAAPPRDLPREHVLYVGRLAQEKGLDLLIEAAVGLDAPVVIAGDGPERAALEELAGALGARNVRFVGFQPSEAVADLYNRALVTVLPSRWYENGPLVILESYVKGTPVVGADIGAVPEFVEEGHTGRLFRAGDAKDLRAVLQRCLDDQAALVRMGEAARRHVAVAYSPEKYVQRLEAVLEGALS